MRSTTKMDVLDISEIEPPLFLSQSKQLILFHPLQCYVQIQVITLTPSRSESITVAVKR